MDGPSFSQIENFGGYTTSLEVAFVREQWNLMVQGNILQLGTGQEYLGKLEVIFTK